MTRDGAIVVVFNEERNQVLLHLREDFRVWALPGGGIEVGETPDTAAIRETDEETGYIIEIIRCIGQYARPQIGDTLHVFEGVVVGGEAIQQGAETLAVKWFSVDDLPKRLQGKSAYYIRNALTNYPMPLKITLTYPHWQIILRAVALKIRNFRNRYLR
jgi:8-oxo-dGTP diphosphatase